MGEPMASEPTPALMHNEKGLLLPKSTVSQIMKSALPRHAKTANDARISMQNCVTEFILFVTGEASDICKKLDKKTITGDEIIQALRNLGFDEYVEPLQIYLTKYRQSTFEERQGEEARGDTDSEEEINHEE
jgi:nuclear transcription Y subunit beta